MRALIVLTAILAVTGCDGYAKNDPGPAPGPQAIKEIYVQSALFKGMPAKITLIVYEGNERTVTVSESLSGKDNTLLEGHDKDGTWNLVRACVVTAKDATETSCREYRLPQQGDGELGNLLYFTKLDLSIAASEAMRRGTKT